MTGSLARRNEHRLDRTAGVGAAYLPAVGRALDPQRPGFAPSRGRGAEQVINSCSEAGALSTSA